MSNLIVVRYVRKGRTYFSQFEYVYRKYFSFSLIFLFRSHHRLFLHRLIAFEGMILQEKAVQREGQRCQRVFMRFRFPFALPNGDAVPVHFCE